MRLLPLALTAVLAVGAPAAPAAAQPAPAPPARPTDCKAAEHAQLDFWVGDWRVFNTADDVEYASSRIEKLAAGCVVRETYDAPKAPGGAYLGTSYSAFDFKDGRWHQMYVDTTGTVTWYTGAREGADMVLDAPGFQVLVRMVYRPQPDGSVRQIGTLSSDGGKSWRPGYDYTYRRR